MDAIVAKVNMLVEKYDSSSPFKIADNLGIQIIYENLGGTLGYYNRAFRMKSIHINENVSEGQKMFICSHELGHAVLHPEANTPFLKKHTLFSTEQIELEANYFAIQMLFSKNHFNGQITIEEAIEEFNIPRKLIENNLSNNYFFI